MNVPGSSTEAGYDLWYGWVADNLGRDPKLTTLAAKAAADVSANGGGFADAANAARRVWRDATAQKAPPVVDDSVGIAGKVALERRASAAQASRWGGRALLAFPAVVEALALLGLLFGGYLDESGGLFLISGGVLILGVPLAFVFTGGVLLATGRNRYAAIAAVLAPASALLNGFIALQLCEAAVRGINYAAPP